jgi:hypothetical protein
MHYGKLQEVGNAIPDGRRQPVLVFKLNELDSAHKELSVHDNENSPAWRGY